jgi:hypothetical protein
VRNKCNYLVTQTNYRRFQQTVFLDCGLFYDALCICTIFASNCRIVGERSIRNDLEKGGRDLTEILLPKKTTRNVF